MLFRAVALACLLLSGCASTRGSSFTIADANRVTNGMTWEEVIKIMGSEPRAVGRDGRVMLWLQRESNLTGPTALAVRFFFGPDGKTYGIPKGGVFGPASAYAPEKAPSGPS